MSRSRKGFLFGLVSSVIILGMVAGCAHQPVDPSWKYSQFKEVEFDPFPGMDFQGRNVQLTQDEIYGRVIWNLWSGDNGGFWNWLVQHGFGTADLLKMVAFPRRERFSVYGIVNQPGYMRPAQPDQYGLYLDVPREAKYDFDSKIDLYTYGRSSGVMGLRLFPNPKFDASKWDVKRFYDDPNYYNNPKLERPYVVGMACSFCHVGPDPVNPPADINEPEYANLSDYVGQHYFKVWEVFGHELTNDNFVKQLLLTNPAGTLDTAFIATDYLNNPGTMNGVYEIPGRLQVAYPELVTGGALHLKNLDRRPDGTVVTPEVLKEGADSVGFNGALSRVYLNIGEYWEEWTRHFNPLIGIRKQSPIEVKVAQQHSPHWNWSESHSPALAKYFIRVAKPHKLADAPGGSRYISSDPNVLNRGKRVFAQNCASCHSSKQPSDKLQPNSPEARKWYLDAVMQPDFLDGNFLSSEQRYAVTLIKTNATRSVATNGMRHQIWDNFSSETYKTLPGVGDIQVWDPFTGAQKPWTVPTGGRGYYRPPSLVSMWASAPYFHNNALGKHVHGASVEDRMAAFDDATKKLLWPENRSGSKPNTDGADGQSTSLWRTTQESWIKLPEPYLGSRVLRWVLRNNMETDPTTGGRYFAFGPIPKGTPVNLLANTNLELNGIGKAWNLGKLLIKGVGVMKDVKRKGLEGDEATKQLMTLVPDLFKLNSCPDFIEDKGHYFGTDLPDADKRALIEYLKTF
jgi:hypothetical protein